MSLAVNKGAKILIGNFFDTYFKAQDKEEAKEKAFEIVDLLLEENENNRKDLATKADIARLEKATKEDIARLEKNISSLERNITESKYDLLKWIFTAQIAVTSLAVAIIVAVIKFF